MNNFLSKLWSDEAGQDVAEYAVMLAVVLVIVVGTIQLIGSNASNVFSNVAARSSRGKIPKFLGIPHPPPCTGDWNHHVNKKFSAKYVR